MWLCTGIERVPCIPLIFEQGTGNLGVFYTSVVISDV